MTLPSEVLQIETPTWRSGDVAMLEEMANRFMDEEIAPHYERYEKQEIVDREAWEKAGETGLLCASMPEEYGGAGLGLTEAALMMQTVPRSGAGYSGASAIHLNIFGPKPLEKFGNAEQKQENLPKIISGEEKMCFAVTEPNSGLDTSSLETKAERTNSGYTINGRKIWTTGAQRADKILIIARTAPKEQCAKPDLGLALF